MVAFSKLLVPLPHTCYELGHTWTPFCSTAALDITKNCLSHSLKIYVTFYVVTALARRKKWKFYKERLLPEILRSTTFLTLHGTLYIMTFCLARRVFGKISIATSSILPALCTCFLSILIERKERRTVLALYLLNLASELAFNMLHSRNMVRSIPYSDVLMFCISSCAYMYLLRSPAGLSESIQQGIRFIVGAGDDGGGADGGGRWRHVWSEVSRRLGTLSARHETCSHAYSCIVHLVQRLTTSFALGYCAQFILRLVSSLPTVVRRPSTLIHLVSPRSLSSYQQLSLGVFLGLYNTIYWSSGCVLRWLRGRDDHLTAAVSGFLSGLSMLAYRSTSISLYLLWKLAEIIYFKLSDRGWLPTYRHADIIVYTLSMSLIFHAALLEPHNIRPGYWKFLLNLTGGRFRDMNRHLLDVYGTGSSKLFSDFYPEYDIRHIVDPILKIS